MLECCIEDALACGWMRWRVFGCITRPHQQASAQRAPSRHFVSPKSLGGSSYHSNLAAHTPVTSLQISQGFYSQNFISPRKQVEVLRGVEFIRWLTPELLSPPIWGLHQTKWGHITPFRGCTASTQSQPIWGQHKSETRL